MNPVNAIAGMPISVAPVSRTRPTRVAMVADTFGVARNGVFAHQVARAALRSLYDEVMVQPKPGLVSRLDSGSHPDMTAALFVRSLFSLRHYFARIAEAGARHQPFDALQRLGQQAECAMLTATGGVNTHRGAIFNLGLIAAAAGWLHAEHEAVTAEAIGRVVRDRFGAAILASRHGAPDSHGLRAATAYGAGGARAMAASGYALLREVALPALAWAVRCGVSRQASAVHVLFTLMARLDDTNLLHRGGPDGLAFARREARRFLDAGSVARPHWYREALALHRAFVQRNLSPGGCADLLAATLFIDALRCDAGPGAM